MINNSKVLAVIPARGGSKRVPGKNLKHYRGKPLLTWAMEHAKASKYIDRFVVSTEDPHIAQAAGRHWLDRPEWLAGDFVGTEPVLVHALYTLPGFDYAVILQPTSPLRSKEDIDRCIEIAEGQAGRNGLYGCVSYNMYAKRNGAVYVTQVKHFLAVLHLKDCHSYEMPNERSLDIDYEWDFKV